MRFRFPSARVFIALLTFSLMLTASPAWAAGGNAKQVLADWRADGTIDGSYSTAALRAARAQARSDELEYSNLGSEIDRALGQNLLNVHIDAPTNKATTPQVSFGRVALIPPAAFVRLSRNGPVALSLCWGRPPSHCLGPAEQVEEVGDELGGLVRQTSSGRGFPVMPVIALLTLVLAGVGIAAFVQNRRTDDDGGDGPSV